MYAVFSRYSNEVDFWDQLLFVTADKQTADDFVTLAELELEAARLIVRPAWDSKKFFGEKIRNYHQLQEEYFANLAACFTVDRDQGLDGFIDDRDYYVKEVEVR